MPSQSISVLALSVVANGAITAQRFVTAVGLQAGAGANVLGVARSSAAAGDALAVDVLGTAIVEAGAAITAGAALETDASGRAVTVSSGAVVARALGPAGQAGERIEVVLIPN